MARERDINDILEEGKEKLRSQVEGVKDRLSDAADDAKERGQEALADAVKLAQKHPVQALGIALVVGAALGVLLFRRERD